MPRNRARPSPGAGPSHAWPRPGARTRGAQRRQACARWRAMLNVPSSCPPTLHRANSELRSTRTAARGMGRPPGTQASPRLQRARGSALRPGRDRREGSPGWRTPPRPPPRPWRGHYPVAPRPSARLPRAREHGIGECAARRAHRYALSPHPTPGSRPWRLQPPLPSARLSPRASARRRDERRPRVIHAHRSPSPPRAPRPVRPRGRGTRVLRSRTGLCALANRCSMSDFIRLIAARRSAGGGGAQSEERLRRAARPQSPVVRDRHPPRRPAGRAGTLALRLPRCSGGIRAARRVSFRNAMSVPALRMFSGSGSWPARSRLTSTLHLASATATCVRPEASRTPGSTGDAWRALPPSPATLCRRRELRRHRATRPPIAHLGRPRRRRPVWRAFAISSGIFRRSPVHFAALGRETGAARLARAQADAEAEGVPSNAWETHLSASPFHSSTNANTQRAFGSPRCSPSRPKRRLPLGNGVGRTAAELDSAPGFGGKAPCIAVGFGRWVCPSLDSGGRTATMRFCHDVASLRSAVFRAMHLSGEARGAGVG